MGLRVWIRVRAGVGVGVRVRVGVWVRLRVGVGVWVRALGPHARLLLVASGAAA